MIKEPSVTQDFYVLPAVVVVHDRKMQEAWRLATSRADLGAAAIVKLYGRRFTIEETFRETKDIHFGMGLKATHIKSAGRRDRLLLLAALAHALLTLLGAAGEPLRARSNTQGKHTATEARNVNLSSSIDPFSVRNSSVTATAIRFPPPRRSVLRLASTRT
jgi:hypothetical protein